MRWILAMILALGLAGIANAQTCEDDFARLCAVHFGACDDCCPAPPTPAYACDGTLIDVTPPTREALATYYQCNGTLYVDGAPKPFLVVYER